MAALPRNCRSGPPDEGGVNSRRHQTLTDTEPAACRTTLLPLPRDRIGTSLPLGVRCESGEAVHQYSVGGGLLIVAAIFGGFFAWNVVTGRTYFARGSSVERNSNPA